MKQELISVIVPCYNAANTLQKYLESIINQTYKNIEVIAVDDGSTDNTAKILNDYVSVFAEKRMSLKYIYEENAGLGAAINTGLKYVTGDYLCWFCSAGFLYFDQEELSPYGFSEKGGFRRCIPFWYSSDSSHHFLLVAARVG